MIKAMRIAQTIVCTINSKMYKKTCNSSDEILELYEQALNTDESDEQEVAALINAFAPTLTAEEKQIKAEEEALENEAKEQQSLLEWMDNIRSLGDEHFEVIGLKLYMKKINITVPEFLAIEFAKRRDNQEDLSAMMNFWRLCALNPDPRCREDLYKFLVQNSMTVTPMGYFVAYRNANLKNAGNILLNDFVAEQWLKVKTAKKGPKNYVVVWNNEDNHYELIHQQKWDIVKDEEFTTEEWDDDEEDYYDETYDLYIYKGNLQDLYVDFVNLNAEDKTVYTDAHSGTTRIVIGETVSLPREQADANPDVSCSRGLHVGASTWLSQGYFGGVGLVVLVNPMSVVSVPHADAGKLRCLEYLPVGLAEYDENGKIIPISTTTFEYDYATHTQEQLEEMVKTTPIESLKEHEIIPKEISLTALKASLQGLRVDLDEMTRIINGRVTNV
jgi:hypothetical protein